MTTQYLVFQRASVTREDSGEPFPFETGWLPVDTFEAHSARDAIRKAAGSLGEQAHDTTLAACAKSHWLELAVAVETKTHVTLGDGSRPAGSLSVPKPTA